MFLPNFSPFVSSLELDPIQNNLNVQALWNLLEYSLITAADIVAPLLHIPIGLKPKTKSTPLFVKSKINKRKRLLKLEKVITCRHHLAEIKVSKKEIKRFFVKS